MSFENPVADYEGVEAVANRRSNENDYAADGYLVDAAPRTAPRYDTVDQPEYDIVNKSERQARFS